VRGDRGTARWGLPHPRPVDPVQTERPVLEDRIEQFEGAPRIPEITGGAVFDEYPADTAGGEFRRVGAGEQ